MRNPFTIGEAAWPTGGVWGEKTMFNVEIVKLPVDKQFGTRGAIFYGS